MLFDWLKRGMSPASVMSLNVIDQFREIKNLNEKQTTSTLLEESHFYLTKTQYKLSCQQN
jgi:hypothetical protein